MRTFGHKHSNFDHNLFIKCNASKIITLIVYIDDIIITRDDPSEMEDLQRLISKWFEMKELGKLKYFLTIEVARSN